MKYEELIILLPCHSLEDFPLHHEGEDAQGLLASWSAMWHPALLASAGALPTWYRVDEPPQQLANRLLIVPAVSHGELPSGLTSRAKEEGACVIRRKSRRDEIVALALEQLDGGDRGVDGELAADFLALGFCYLQIELLTRQMRYSSNLDEVYFRNQTVAAANAAVEGNVEEARRLLQSCFDVLGEERDHYYPVDAFLVDLSLVAPTTLGQSFRDELARPTPVNLLISGETLQRMAAEEPASLAALRDALQAGTVNLIGGEYIEGRLPLYERETILAELKRGLAVYEEILGRRPLVYGRRRFGLWPLLPPILQKLGFTGALHATLDDGQFPEGAQTKIGWEGVDGTRIDAIARAPRDASKPETFLNFSIKMGESMDTDHVATMVFAHWPGKSSPWYDDLRRIARFTSALGKFVSIENYFRDTADGGQLDRFEAGLYRPPYLKQAIIRRHKDPISSVCRYYRQRSAAEARQSLVTLVQLLGGDGQLDVSPLLSQIDQQFEEAGRTADDEPAGEDSAAGVENGAAESGLSEALAQFASRLPGTGSATAPGYLVANPLSFSQRAVIDVSQMPALPAVEKPVVAAGESKGLKHVVVDVPPLGFAWLSAGGNGGRSSRPAQSLAEGNLLRNEFFEIRINPTTGTLQSLHDYRVRGNRLSQQLALRRPPARRPQPGDVVTDPDETAAYSVMVADSCEVTLSDAACGEIVSRGRLVDREGKTLAGFQQRYQVVRGSRLLRLSITLDPQEELRADPRNSYYACRFAWANEAALLWRGVGLSRQKVAGKQCEAPHFIEIEDAAQRTVILTGGLPYHRLVGMRMLDTLLVVRGETQKTFELGIAVDVSHPAQEALAFLSPAVGLFQPAAPTAEPRSGWLFHLDAKNVVATHWEPIIDDGKPAGFRVRLLETGGRSGRISLRSFRAPRSARLVDFRGGPLVDCPIDGDKIAVELAAAEWVELEARF